MPSEDSRRSAQNRALGALARAVNLGHVQPELSRDILAALASAVKADAAQLFVYDDDSYGVLRSIACVDEDRCRSHDALHAAGESLIAQCLRNRSYIIENNVTKSRRKALPRNTRSCAVVPIGDHFPTIAVLAMYSTQIGKFDRAYVRFLESVSPLLEAYLLGRDYSESERWPQLNETFENNQDFAFVLMPFREPFNKYYDSIIVPAIESASIRSLRADEIYRPSEIIKDIYKHIEECKLLIVELTGRNANVLYELGYGHALEKPAVLLTQTMDDIPFDLRGYRCIVYDTREPDWAENLRATLTKFIRAVDS